MEKMEELEQIQEELKEIIKHNDDSNTDSFSISIHNDELSDDELSDDNISNDNISNDELSDDEYVEIKKYRKRMIAKSI
jgi:hypothetical protein